MKAFLSLPLTVNFTEDRVFKADRKEFYSSVISAITSCGYEVVSAVLNENWGRIVLPVKEFTRFDHDEIVSSAALIVVSSEGLSRDIYLEIGIAVGRGIPVFIFVSTETRQTYMLQGLHQLCKVQVDCYANELHAPELIRSTLIRDRRQESFEVDFPR